MHKTSLKDWVILLTIVPTTIIAFGLASYFSYSRYIELDNFIQQRAHSIIEPLAIISKESLVKKDRETLRKLISFTHRSQSSIVNSIVVFTKDHQVFVTSAYKSDTQLMRLGQEEKIPLFTESEENTDYFIFRSPIIDEQYNFINDQLLNSPPQQTPKSLAIGYIAIQIDKSKINFTQQSQILIAFSMALLGILLSAIFSVRLISTVTKPVNSMVQAIERVRDGKLESRVSGTLIGELNFLKTGINAMAQSLDSYQNEMQSSIDQATIDLRESLEQFEIQNVELSIAKRKAQEANKVKSEFLANMSHELRTPLNGVIGFTRQVLKTPLTDNQRDYLQTIDRSANNLLAIINDILDFSKLDAGKVVIENIPFSLRESFEEAIALLAPAAHKKDINLSVNISNKLPDSLIGDVMRIKQIITNLISNAIKFTAQGSVEVDILSENISEKSVMLKVQVTDTGIGMTKKQQRTIFDAFTQADQSITRLYGGTGLGLVICQRLAKEMSGNIGFTSEKNQGSTFWFTFLCEMNSMPLMLELDSHHLNEKSILLFEEHEHSRHATLELLSHWKMQVTCATNSHQLEQMLVHASQRKDVFDYALIGHNHNATALSHLKKLIAQISPLSSEVYIAINSNSPSLHEALTANGANGCLSKPLSALKLSRAFQPLSVVKQENQPTSSGKVIPIKVLAVDDNEANLKLIKALLDEQVSEVVLADNGQTAIDLCNQEKFSLIFMDIQMPIMDGISTLKAIKAQTKNNTTPIIAVTAHALDGEKEKMHQQGFNAYMTKPIDETMLSHIIYEYCDVEHFITQHKTASTDDKIKGLVNKHIQADKNHLLPHEKQAKQVIDWPLALTRSANKVDLAREMLMGLTNSLPSTQEAIAQAKHDQDIAELKRLVHKLNGACCYTGTPNLANITSIIETQLKMKVPIEDLEPEFLEFFEQIDQVLAAAPSVLGALDVETP